jgi:hypothetical protein
MPRPLRFSVFNSDPNMQSNYVKESTADIVPPGKLHLHFYLIPVHQSVLGLASLFLVSNQLRSTN